MNGVTAEELRAHASPKDCWIQIEDGVYDVTRFLAAHPGGERAILRWAGKDATTEFHKIHWRRTLEGLAQVWRVGVRTAPGLSARL